MTPAVATLLALLGAIVLSCVSRINVGLVGIALAWLIGVFYAGLSAETIAKGFPTSLFLTLTGVTLLFSVADANQTLERLAQRAMGLARGNRRLVPLLFFLVACLISTLGPGAISTVALVVPLAMAIGARVGVPAFLTALMVANGANAGNLSPMSSVGIVANTKMAAAGLGGHEGKVWLANLVAHALVGGVGYLAFGGLGLKGPVTTPAPELPNAGGLTRQQRITVSVILAWIAGVLLFKLNLGLSAFAAAAVLVAAGVVEEGAVFRRVPWNIIIMVTGVTVLIGLLEETGGMDLFTGLLVRVAKPATVNGVVAMVTGAISTYSSTAGVVLPTFLPTVPGIVAKLGGGDPLAVALSINVGSSVVDVSPLSTLGALCVAAVVDPAAARILFRRLMMWGLSMVVVGAVLCQLLAGALARW